MTAASPGTWPAAPPPTRTGSVPPPGVPRSRTVAARGLIIAIRAYQLARAGRVSPCRFTPSCSQYAVEAIARHGLWRGLGLAARRLGRCRPGGPFGPDPVPE